MSDAEKLQKELAKELEQANVKVAKDAAAKMKENILSGNSGNWLGLGVHEVSVDKIELTRANSGTLGMTFTVSNADGKTEVTMWLSQAALPYTIENCSRLAVHNAEQDKKDKARNFMSNILSAKELFDTMVQMLKERKKAGKEFACWVSIRESKTQTYVNKDGDTVPSIERSLLSYKPKEEAKTVATNMVNSSEGVDLSEIPF
jgi:hypothetical protein